MNGEPRGGGYVAPRRPTPLTVTKMRKRGTITFGIATVLALPVIVPVMLVRNAMDARYQRRMADAATCKNCGRTLGKAAILESNRIISDEMKDRRRINPGVKFRTIRNHHAICTNCGQQYEYSNQGKMYLPLESKNHTEQPPRSNVVNSVRSG